MDQDISAIGLDVLQAKLTEIESARDQLRIQQAYQLGLQDGAVAILRQLIEQQNAQGQSPADKPA